jgi:hypothetical protein
MALSTSAAADSVVANLFILSASLGSIESRWSRMLNERCLPVSWDRRLVSPGDCCILRARRRPLRRASGTPSVWWRSMNREKTGKWIAWSERLLHISVPIP